MSETGKVSILMGSDSDLPVMKEAYEILKQFSIDYEVKVISAHRSPRYLTEYLSDAIQRGIKVVIAGAGGAAHLPGVVASYFPLAVIGVPIKSKSLEGLDSLLSIVQMPPGVPVATVGINQAKNAGILAVQILATNDAGLLEKFIVFKKKLEEDSLKKNDNLNL
ncbi:MAG: 5-(carboxyamino)imidazole ribonucleotide mutase [Ignavibacteriaceae bacterium]